MNNQHSNGGTLMPSLFVSHGPPSILLMENHPAWLFFVRLKKRLLKPRAIVCVSAHFESVWPIITASPTPSLIYDFSGPPPLFGTRYPVAGDPNLARHLADTLKDVCRRVDLDDHRGLDHGVWVPLSLMYPNADIPVVQLSIQTGEKPDYHIMIGKALSPLRKKGVIILGSGGATHNLDDIHGRTVDQAPQDYAIRFDNWLKSVLESGNIDALEKYKDLAPHAWENHPYPAEHLIPLLVTAGSAGVSPKAETLFQGFMYSVLSMASYGWGMPR